MLPWGTTTGALLSSDDPGFVPLPSWLPLHPRFPPTGVRVSPCFPLSSQCHYLSFGSFLGFLFLQNWGYSAYFSSFLLQCSSGRKHPDTFVFMYACHFIHLTHNIDTSDCRLSANHDRWATKMLLASLGVLEDRNYISESYISRT